MMKYLYLLFIKILAIALFYLFPIIGVLAQSQLSGSVSNKKGESLPFANIQIEGSYDGATANIKGKYKFITNEKGTKVLKVTMVGFNEFKKEIILTAKPLVVDIQLVESISMLNAVVVTAGMFEASDEKKMVMMKPIDIVTTAGGNGDIVSVMQMLPGAGRVGEAEGLFVRGGSANETKTVIDGMIVQNPFFSSTPDVPQRGRFDPFMFKGTSFSTGGYSAQYGQALSSVLLLNTQDKQSSHSNTNISVNLASMSLTHSHKGWLTGTVYYSNIKPLIAISHYNINFEKVPEGIGAALTINEVLKNKASIKAYSTFSKNSSSLFLPSYNQGSRDLFANTNNNIFTNASYKQTYNEGKWVLNSGFSYSRNTDNLNFGNFNNDRLDQRIQGRLVLSKTFGKDNMSTLNFGTEIHKIDLNNAYGENKLSLADLYSAGFAEAEITLSNDLAIRPGIRAEYSSLIGEFNLAPRLSMAYKTGIYSQISIAGGRFYQNPEKEYLYMNKNLSYELADHFIANYQIIKNKRTFRTEFFYKKYSKLVVEKTAFFDANPYRFPTGATDNSGSGYAQGFDVFIRDQQSLKNGDLWLSYSFLDTERKFKNYPVATMPGFASKHNMNLVYKQFFPKITTNIGLTFSNSFGRPVYAPNDSFKKVNYLKPYQNLSFMASKIKQRKNNFLVIYAIMDNLLGRNNIFGYRYSPDTTQKFEVKPPVKRMIFFGFTYTFGKMNGRSKEADLNF